MTVRETPVNQTSVIGASNLRARSTLVLAASFLLALTLKGALILDDAISFNADEAVVGLMARHILAGERPVFFYGQSYLGSLDAWLSAAVMTMVGQKVLAIRLLQTFLYAGTVATTYLLGRKIFNNRWIGTVATLLMAIPPILVTVYTTASLGGYGEVLFLGNVLLLLTLRIGKGPQTRSTLSLWPLFGALAGLGFWGFGLLGVYIAPCVLWLLWKEFKTSESILSRGLRWGTFGVSFLLGSFPWWLSLLTGSTTTINELAGNHIASAQSGIGIRLLDLFILYPAALIGLRPPWDVRLLALPLAPLALGVFFATLGFLVVRLRSEEANQVRAGRLLLLGVSTTTLVGLLATPFGADPSGRYILPLAVPLALFTAELLQRIRTERPRFALGILGGLLAFNLWGTIETAMTTPPGITTQFDAIAQIDKSYDEELINFLLQEEETRGYANYWITFPLAFLSDEELIYSAQLPYHADFRYTPRDDRYAPYTEAVASADKVAYITSNHPALDELIRVEMTRLQIGFEEKQIGAYHIFYALSQPVRPHELGLGTERA